MLYLRVVAAFGLLFMVCSPQTVTKTGGVSHETCPPVSERPVDTLGYTITFTSGPQREQFIRSFRSFMEEYPFSELRNDTIAGQVVIRMAPFRDQGSPMPSLTPIEPSRFSEGTVEGQGVLPKMSAVPGQTTAMEGSADAVIPQTGGLLRLYTQRLGIDETFLPLVTINPFVPQDSTGGPVFTVTSVAPKKITLQINGRLVDGTGRVLSALDLIEAWTGFVRKHPAEGLALFRHVEGIREFIAGREAVIRGIGAVDQKTCYLRLSQSDTLAERRIATRRLCGSIHSKIGPYYPVQTKGMELALLPNLKAGRRVGLLDTLLLSVNEDKNPILSFSLKKYDAITLTTASDAAYARSTLEKQATLRTVSNDRYFISCSVADPAVRRFIAATCNGGDLLRNSVKGTGKPLAMIEVDSESVVIASGDGVAPPPATGAGLQVRILFRSDDAVSRRIAEKLLADLSGKGVRCALDAAGITEYERALVERKYDCAVGWVSQQVLTDASERLRLATIWFEDNNNEADRIARFYELPLFSIERYLLLRKPAGLYRGAVEGIFATSKPVEELPQ